MKNAISFILLFLIAAALQHTSAQTNTFPATGNVGIGTVSPASKLDILPANGNAISIRPYGTAANSTGQLQFKELAANGSNHIAFRAPDALASNYVFRLPVNYGTNGQVLTSNGAGVLSWTTIAGGGGGGASTSLNNLVTTNINQHLIPSANNLRDLGTTAKGWRNIYATGDYYLDAGRVLSVSGTSNTFIGLTANTTNTGIFNTFIGSDAGKNNTNGGGNIALGTYSLRDNTTGSSNIGLGPYTLSTNNGSNNVAAGYAALTNNNGGSNNSAYGRQALWGTSGASNNVAFGSGAGSNAGNGWNNTFLGTDAIANSGGLFNMIAIGQACRVYASSETVIGNPSTVTTGAYTNWSNYSDGRYKKDVKENVKGLEFIMKLRPVTYHLDVTGLNERDRQGRMVEEHPEMKKIVAEKEKMLQTGFIAQEVEAAAKAVGFDFSGVDAPRSENDLYALRYAEFVVPLVKAVQELNKKNAELRMQNAELLKNDVALQNELQQIKSVMNAEQQQRLSALQNDKASLEQNIPNPFNKSTVIKYFLPADFKNAELKIYSSNGVEMKSYSITQSGKGEIIMEANTLVAGIYSYTLIMDGEAADVRQMIVTK